MNTIRANDLRVNNKILLSGGDVATVTSVTRIVDGKYKNHINFSWATKDGFAGSCTCRIGRRIKLSETLA